MRLPQLAGRIQTQDRDRYYYGVDDIFRCYESKKLNARAHTHTHTLSHSHALASRDGHSYGPSQPWVSPGVVARPAHILLRLCCGGISTEYMDTHLYLFAYYIDLHTIWVHIYRHARVGQLYQMYADTADSQVYIYIYARTTRIHLPSHIYPLHVEVHVRHSIRYWGTSYAWQHVIS